MSFFAKAVDRRSRRAMATFLSSHFRYDTAGSHNRSTSYAHCIKINRLGLNREQTDAAYEMLGAESFWDQIDHPISDFTRSMHGSYTIGTNGRSGGYLVLYRSQYESTEYLSRCRSCGQQSYKRVAPTLTGSESVIGAEILRNGCTWHDAVYLGQSAIQALALSDEEKLALVRKLKPQLKDCTDGNRCGRCSATGDRGRVNYEKSPSRLSTWPMRSIDQDVDFSDMGIDELRSRVEVVAAFDAACDEIRENFIDLLSDFVPVERTIMVPKTVTVLERRAA